MKKLLLLLFLAWSFARADEITLRNDSATPRVMIAQGVEHSVAVDVPAGESVVVEVGRLPLSFDFENARNAFLAGFFLVFPFGVWRASRGIFNEAD